MSPVEKLEAAIAKLEELKAESTQPTDGNAWIQGRNWRRYENDTEVFTGPNEDTPGAADIVTYIDRADAELIVTLHRTIDAQLLALRYCRDMEGKIGLRFNPLDHAVLALADAILGNPA